MVKTMLKAGILVVVLYFTNSLDFQLAPNFFRTSSLYISHGLKGCLKGPKGILLSSCGTQCVLCFT